MVVFTRSRIVVGSRQNQIGSSRTIVLSDAQNNRKPQLRTYKSYSLVGAAVASFGLTACGSGGGGDGPGPANPGGPALIDVLHPEPAPSNTTMRLFGKPFAGDYRLQNYFDHDRPAAPNDTNGYQLNWQGARAYPGRDVPGYDGHTGVDWALPEGTPVLAVTAGRVVFAGNTTPAPCWLQNNEVVSSLMVIIGFIAPDGQTYTVSYNHLNHIDVTRDERVAEGQQIGLSGATGCVGRLNGRPSAHLHFQMNKVVDVAGPRAVPVDPFGWEGPGVDPWSTHPDGTASLWFWKEGQAPNMAR
jgi:murein DD-endopeptidase MepM/ murein hydrolase activator NlpD